MKRSLASRLAMALALVLATTLLGGCAALHSVSSEVTSYGEWPADRKPGSYAFERLPSQQARAAEADEIEAAARGALQKAGFVPVAPDAQPDVLVQVGVRSDRARLSPWNDSLWWGGSFGFYRHGPWVGPNWGLSAQFDSLRYEREVAMLIRDRASGRPLFEAHARNEGGTAQPSGAALAAMFEAALMDFPQVGVNPRRVVVDLPD